MNFIVVLSLKRRFLSMTMFVFTFGDVLTAFLIRTRELVDLLFEGATFVVGELKSRANTTFVGFSEHQSRQ